MNKRLLVLDDEGSVTKLAMMVLKLNGYDVVESNDPMRALDLLKNEQYDLVITDMMMPGMDGMSVIRSSKEYESCRNTKYIILTAKKLNEEERRELFNHGVEIMSKPFVPNVLLDRIGMLLQ